MRHLLSAIVLLFLSGCSINQLLLTDEIDKVNVVKYTPYVKHHRAYFAREHLRPVYKKQKYLFLYHPKKNELGVLLRRQDGYYLYHFTKPKSTPLKLSARHGLSQTQMLKSFSKAGYKIANLTKEGYSAKVGLRRYKGVKTLLVETKNYQKLKKIYEKAIRNYNADSVAHIHTLLPKKFISPYLFYYYKRAKNAQQQKQLQTIASKLHIVIPKRYQLKKKSITSTQKDKKKRVKSRVSAKRSAPKPSTQAKKTVSSPASLLPSTEDIEHEEEEALIPAQEPPVKPYNYYLHFASLYELSNYLDDPENRYALSQDQYRRLKRRLDYLQEENLLQEGSLENLIAAYKQNRNPRFKQRIMELMKKKQEEEAKN